MLKDSLLGSRGLFPICLRVGLLAVAHIGYMALYGLCSIGLFCRWDCLDGIFAGG